jgi:hypothetical protein
MFTPSNPPDLNAIDFMALANAEMIMVNLVGAVINTAYTYTVPAGKKLIVMGIRSILGNATTAPTAYLRMGDLVLAEVSSNGPDNFYMTTRKFPLVPESFGANADNAALPLLRWITGLDPGVAAAGAITNLPAASGTNYMKFDAPYLFCLKAGSTITIKTGGAGATQCTFRALCFLIDE